MFMRRVIRMPIIGKIVSRWLVKNYRPRQSSDQLTFRTSFGENIIFEPLAHMRYNEPWLFKVYTSDKALRDRGIVTTIYMQQIDLPWKHFINDAQRERFISHEFIKRIKEYEEQMNESFDKEQRQRIADGLDFSVNATKKIAHTTRGEMPLDVYMKGVTA